MFCAPGLILGGTEGAGSCFNVLRSQTRYGQYLGLRVQFFMFCAFGLIFDGTEGVGSSFHVLRFRTHFGRYRGLWVLISCFALPNSFSTVPRVPGLILMFCAPELIFDDTEGAGFYFHILRSQTSFRRYRGCRVPFSCFKLPDTFSAVPRASGLVFMCCVPGLIFEGTEGVGSRLHILCSRTCFGRYRGRRVHISIFVLPDSFSAVPSVGILFV
jgi:hypothetical protein